VKIASDAAARPVAERESTSAAESGVTQGDAPQEVRAATSQDHSS